MRYRAQCVPTIRVSRLTPFEAGRTPNFPSGKEYRALLAARRKSQERDSSSPPPTQGAWWALSDNGYGTKWNSSDYRLCVYLFDVRPRTQTGPDSRAALQAVIELSDPAKFFPWPVVRWAH